MTDEILQQTVQIIESAFANTPYPGDQNIGGEYRDYAPLIGVRWQDVPFDTIFRGRSELRFLTNEGLRYYLPAFMRVVLLDYDNTDTLPGDLIGLLSPPEPKELNTSIIIRFQEFNKIEAFAILAFLESYVKLNREEAWDDNRVYRPLLDRAIVYWKQASGEAVS